MTQKNFVSLILLPLLFVVGGGTWLQAKKGGSLDTGDASFALVGRKLHPGVALSYFDHEGHSPFKGEARSKLFRLREEIKEGNKTTELFTFQFNFNLVEGWDKYMGWYFSMKQGVADFSNKTKLTFEMKGTKDIPTDYFLIGVRSINVDPSINEAKLFLSELGYKKFPTKYTKIEIPVTLLQEKEPNLDMSKINDLLLFGFVGPAADIEEQSVWLRNASWDWGLEKTKDGGLMATLSNLHFDTGKSDIKTEMEPILDRLLKELRKFKDNKFTIVGHTDSVGDHLYNMNLSQRRAESVANYLIEKGSIQKTRVTVVGKGPDEPVSTNETDAGRAQNRRVEVVIN